MNTTRDELIRATKLREQRRFAEAASAYERVVAAAPLLATEWYNLGFCRRMAGRYREALDAYERAIQLGVTAPEEAHLNRGVIFADHLLSPDLAEREYTQALGLNPKYCPALLNLANLAEDRGDRSQATELYRRVLDFDSEHWLALARYGKLLQDPATESDLLARLERGAHREDVGPADRASLCFALGDIHDKLGSFDLAFEAYSRANALSKAASGARYDRAAEEAYVSRLIAEAWPAVPLDEGCSEGSPIFICGMFRAGSTLTEQILAGHPRVTPGGELDLLPSIVRSRFQPFPNALTLAGDEYVRDAAHAYRTEIKQLLPNAECVTDKRPDNFLYVGLIKRMFPSAKIVHTVRHPLDNVLSVFFLHLDASMNYATDLADIAHHLRLSRQLMAHWRGLYGDDIIEFDYDRFVANPRESAQALLASLGLDWEEDCLAFHERRNAVKTASVWQVREPLYGTSSGRWKNYAVHLGDVAAYLSDLR